MDQMRLLIALVLSFLVFFGYNYFFPQSPQTQPESKIQAEPSGAIPEDPASKVKTAETKPVDLGSAAAAAPGIPSRIIEVETPLYTLGISERGAAINKMVLRAFREASAKDSPLKNLLPADGSLDALSVGLAGKSIPGIESMKFRANPDMDRLSVNEGSRQVVFRSPPVNGVQVEKVFTFSADTYAIGLEVIIINAGDQPFRDRLVLALRDAYPQKKNSNVFEGPSLLLDKKLETVELDDIPKTNSFSGKIKWIALESRYFMLGLAAPRIPEADVRLAMLPGHVVESQYLEPEMTVAAGGQQKFEYLVYFGPKSTPALEKAGHELDRVIDYGTFDILAKPCVWLMNYLYGIIPNYGVAIIILTILTKILLWPLGTKSYKSMSQMKKLQPLIQEIREKYKGDRKKMNEEVMRLHRTYNINPLGGCLPMLVQIPVFFALYRMLDQAIELRHAPFLGWIDDLAAPDRLFRFDFSIPFMEPPYGIPVLTLVMGATMFWQQKMSPPAGDPAQAKMMLMMPVVFTAIFINFSSGLVLYWLVSNVLSIGQQYYTQKKFA
jgi:YidC/Oxa1 family membrane protein insertase